MINDNRTAPAFARQLRIGHAQTSAGAQSL
jgi:hypothetical protein